MISRTQLLESIPDLGEAFVFDTLNSTSDFGKELGGENANFPVLVYTREQTAGRGRGNKSWFSVDGSLTFSLVFDAASIKLQKSLLSIAGGVAVAQSLNELTGSELFQVKWPNDVLSNGKKVSGILIETAHSANPTIIVGCGINLNCSIGEVANQNNSAAENRLEEIATSVSEASGIELDVELVLVHLVKRFLKLLQSKDFEVEIFECFKRLDSLLGEEVTVKTSTEAIAGTGYGISADGALLIQTPNGLREVWSGTVLSF